MVFMPMQNRPADTVPEPLPADDGPRSSRHDRTSSPPGTRPRALVLAFGVLLLVLIASSRPVRVGDGRDYLAMALNLARLRSPALSLADIALIGRRLDAWHFDGHPLASHPELQDARGRQDFYHFWFYPALAVPGIWLTMLAGVHPNYGFVALNVALFMGALSVVSRRVVWWLTATLFCGPALWWIDKSHTELFTFSLLAAAFALLREAPWWSLVAIGAAATQNLPIAGLLVPAGIVALVHRPAVWRDRRFQVGASIGAALALLHPVYYWWRWGLLTPQLLRGTVARVPTPQELGAVLWDPNIGLLFHAPLLVLTFAAVAVAVTVRAWPRLRDAEVGLAAAAAGIFLLSFTQTTNVNSGATPGMSRYTLWLLPLAVPILQRAPVVVSPRLARWFVPLALASCAWSIVAFAPRRPEHYRAPTRIASVIWARWPSLDNPLPEIFAERVGGREPGAVPVATPGCTKVLTVGGAWPVPCLPGRNAPSTCGTSGALCYANLVNGRYRLVRVRSPAGYTFDRQRTWVWDRVSGRGVERILSRVRSRELRPVSPGDPGGMVQAADGVSWTYELQSEGELLVYVGQPREGASLTLRLPGSMTGAWLDPDTGDEIEPIRVDTRPQELTLLVPRPGRATVLALGPPR